MGSNDGQAAVAFVGLLISTAALIALVSYTTSEDPIFTSSVEQIYGRQ